MNKKLSVLFTLIVAVFSLVSLVGAQEKFAVGAKIADFSLPEMNGQTKFFDDLKGANGAVFVFVSAQCPVVKGYNERLVKLAADYQSKGINVVGINSNATESLESIKTYADENYKAQTGYKFPILIDKNNVWADKLGATATPEVYFFDEKGVLLYRGAIDNDRTGKNASENYLRDALDAKLGGKAIAKTSANAFGCSIKRVKN